MSTHNATFPLTIYYDASCPLCRKEMHTLRDYDRRTQLPLVDCSAPDFHDPARNRMALSKIGFTAAFGWLVERAAQRALARSKGCEDGVCERPEQARGPH